MQMPEMKAFNKGRDVYLAFEDDVGELLHTSFSPDPDEENIILTEVATMVRRDLFAHEIKFTGSFNKKSQTESVPQSLLTLVNMIINGSNINPVLQKWVSLF